MTYTTTAQDIIDARGTAQERMRAMRLREENKQRTARAIIVQRESMRRSLR